MKKTAITLLSGGFDSAVATLLAQKNYEIVLALTFDYGQRAAKQEIKATRHFCKYYKINHQVITLPWLAEISYSSLTDKSKTLPRFEAIELDRKKEKEKKSAKAVWVPNRNAIFVSVAAAFAEGKGINTIIAGFNAEEAETFPDNSKEFIDVTNRLFSYSTLSHPRLLCPTQNMTKTQIASKAIRLKLDPQFLWSCYEGGAKMCGQCESCARIIRAFKTIGAWELIRNLFRSLRAEPRNTGRS